MAGAILVKLVPQFDDKTPILTEFFCQNVSSGPPWYRRGVSAAAGGCGCHVDGGRAAGLGDRDSEPGGDEGHGPRLLRGTGPHTDAVGLRARLDRYAAQVGGVE